MGQDQGNQHGRLVDDQLARETEALVHGSPDEGRTEGRRQQAPGPDEPELHAGDRPEVEAEVQRDARAALAAAVTPAHFPAERDELVATARSEDADPDLVNRLAGLNPDRQFATVEEVWEALPHA